MHYLQLHLDHPFSKLLSKIVPNHSYKSIHDLFSSQFFNDFLHQIINKIPELQEVPARFTIQDENSGESYESIKIHNFVKIFQMMKWAYEEINIPFEQEGHFTRIKRMVNDYDLDELQWMLEILVQLLIHNQEVVLFITTMEEEDQKEIKQFITVAKNKRNEISSPSSHMKNKKATLQEKIYQYESVIASKQSDYQTIKEVQIRFQEDNEELQEIIAKKEQEVEELKKRLIAYEETDTLFMEKDEEINKYVKLNMDLEVKNKIVEKQLYNLKNKHDSKYEELEQKYIENQHSLDKTYAMYESISKQKEELEFSHKKVINNLKQKNKTMNQKISQIQTQLIQFNFEKQIKEKEYNELLASYQELKIKSKGRNPNNFMEKIINSSGGKEFIKLSDEIQKIDKQNDFQEEIMMYETAGEQNLKKFQQILAENARLKQKVSLYEGRKKQDSQEQIEKLKKRITILKRKIEETDSQRKEEIEILIAAYENSIKI